MGGDFSSEIKVDKGYSTMPHLFSRKKERRRLDQTTFEAPPEPPKEKQPNKEGRNSHEKNKENNKPDVTPQKPTTNKEGDYKSATLKKKIQTSVATSKDGSSNEDQLNDDNKKHNHKRQSLSLRERALRGMTATLQRHSSLDTTIDKINKEEIGVVKKLLEQQEIKEKEVQELTENILLIKQNIKTITQHKNLQINQLNAQLQEAYSQINQLNEHLKNQEKEASASHSDSEEKLRRYDLKLEQKEKEVEYWKDLLQQTRQNTKQSDQTMELEEQVIELQQHLEYVKEELEQTQQREEIVTTQLELAFNETEDLKQEYFSSLCLCLRISMASKGIECNVDLKSLWEKCKVLDLDYHDWRRWLQEQFLLLSTSNENVSFGSPRSARISKKPSV